MDHDSIDEKVMTNARMCSARHRPACVTQYAFTVSKRLLMDSVVIVAKCDSRVSIIKYM